VGEDSGADVARGAGDNVGQEAKGCFQGVKRLYLLKKEAEEPFHDVGNRPGEQEHDADAREGGVLPDGIRD